MFERQRAEPTRIPRADKLNLARDILHLLVKNGYVLTLNSLFIETRKHFTPPKAEVWKWETFNEYIIFLKRLKLAKVTPTIIRILQKGKSVVGSSNYAQEELGEFEKQIFKSLLLSYSQFRKFLSVSFCKGQSFRKEKELFERSKCPRRTDLLKAYMTVHNQKDDREARTALYWGIQIGLIEFDEYHESYFLVNPRRIDFESFLHSVFQAYSDARDLKSTMALIPEVRFRTCCALKVSKRTFDKYLIKSFNERPTTIELGKASISRAEVIKYGITDNSNCYYYIRIAER